MNYIAPGCYIAYHRNRHWEYMYHVGLADRYSASAMVVDRVVPNPGPPPPPAQPRPDFVRQEVWDRPRRADLESFEARTALHMYSIRVERIGANRARCPARSRALHGSDAHGKSVILAWWTSSLTRIWLVCVAASGCSSAAQLELEHCHPTHSVAAGRWRRQGIATRELVKSKKASREE